MQNITAIPESLWDYLLSREEYRIRAAFASLNSQEKQAVLEHLRTMSSEPDWHPEQRKSAAAALHALGY